MYVFAVILLTYFSIVLCLSVCRVSCCFMGLVAWNKTLIDWLIDNQLIISCRCSHLTILTPNRTIITWNVFSARFWPSKSYKTQNAINQWPAWLVKIISFLVSVSLKSQVSSTYTWASRKTWKINLNQIVTSVILLNKPYLGLSGLTEKKS